ncbi:MAG: sugar transferase [Desulfobacterales bacterium]|nr:sugar transferase [Desulfobacterales bacterium]
MNRMDQNNSVAGFADRRSEENAGFLTVNKIMAVDFVLLTVSYFLWQCIKRGSIGLDASYFSLLWGFYGCWILSSVLARKFRVKSYQTYGDGVLVCLKSGIYLMYLIALMIVLLGLFHYSRLHVFGTCATLTVFNVLAWSLYSALVRHRAMDRVSVSNFLAPFRLEKKISYPLLGVDFALVIFSFFLVNYLKRGDVYLSLEYIRLLVIFIGLWFVFSVSCGKYDKARYRSVHFFTWQWVKAGGMMFAAMAVLIFGAHMFYLSRGQALGSVLVLTGLELFLAGIYYRIKKNGLVAGDVESVDQVQAALQQEALSLDVDVDLIRQRLMEPAREKFRNRVGENNPELFAFMDQHIDLDDMVRMETSIERSCESIDLGDDRVPVRLMLNLWKINDIRRVNAYFLKVHRRLLPGGYYIGYAHTIQTHYDWMFQKFPRYVAGLLYTLDFCFNRVMPKLPWLKTLYFILTQGKGRVISKAEVLGRLCFCGFEIVAEKNIGKRLYVIARKVKTASLDKSPTYGPLIALKRSGYAGEVLNVYKFRTMHPYSEYLQQYVYDKQGLQKGGKIENDFRMTTWGKIMRKLWLDELPMLYNWIRGDLSIVGVRPLSFHYLGLYDAELQELRKKVKPGLVPPFYADLPVTFEEICESERRYIRSFLNHPVRAQVVYFYKAFVNIVVKGARSH